MTWGVDSPGKCRQPAKIPATLRSEPSTFGENGYSEGVKASNYQQRLIAKLPSFTS